MPIIYTYPKLLNPIGNELIVITDVNDKKFTKQITIGQIAGLLPGGDGCGTAITEIIDNLGASLYTAPACSPMEIVSTDGTVSITSTGSGINLSASAASGCEAALTDILTPGGPVTVTQCGGTIEFSVPPESNLGIVGAGNTIEFSLGCPTESERGGIKATSVELPSPPNPSETGEYYPVQITGGSDCVGVVRVPSTEPYVLTCAEPTVLGGVKVLNNTELSAPPTVADTGTYYPIETLTATATQADECRAVVRVPDQAPVETEALIEQVYNSTGSTILKGTPLHINGTGTGPELNPAVDIANATNPLLMPVSGLAAEDIAVGANGPMIISGLLRDVTTNTISGVTGAGDVIYASTVVGPSTPWLTGVQPSTEGNLVQNVGIVSKYAGAGVGSIQVSAIGRTNATPNLDEGSIFVGNAANYSTELPIGAANTVLTSNGATASWSPVSSSNGELLYSNLFIATNTSQTNPPQYALNNASSTSTALNQVQFDPAVAGTGTGTLVYAYCKRPQNDDDIVRVVFNFSIKHSNDDATVDEVRVYAGLHNADGNILPSNLAYGWQGNGYSDSNDSFLEVQNYRFAWDITVSDLKTLDGEPAIVGDNCYFYLKMSFMDNSLVSLIPSVLFGRYFQANYSSTSTSTMLNGIPCTCDTYLLANNKHDLNPVPI